MAGFKDFAHEIRKREMDYPLATAQHVAIYAKDNNRVYIVDENGKLADFEVNDSYFNDVYVYGNVSISGNTTHYGWISSPGVSGVENESFGFESLRLNLNGNNNAAVGYKSMYYNTDGSANVAVGHGSMFRNTDGSANVAVGFDALSVNISGSHNVAIGNQAGSLETGSNKLYISNTAGTSADALIYGEFDTKQLYLHNYVEIGTDQTDIDSDLVLRAKGQIDATDDIFSQSVIGAYDPLTGQTSYFSSGSLSVAAISGSPAFLYVGDNTVSKGLYVSWDLDTDTTTATIQNGEISYKVAVPTANNDPGRKGQVAYDNTHFYQCIASNTWKRVAWDAW